MPREIHAWEDDGGRVVPDGESEGAETMVSDKEKLETLYGLLMWPLLALHVALSGLVLSLCWGWFLTPVVGTASPGFAACLGLAMTVRAFAGSGPTFRKEEDMTAAMAVSLLRGLIALGLAWLLHWFV